jgi:ABC-type multidrug transport system fused ATPase/permease subunit
MSSESMDQSKKFKYKMSFYYVSTIIYFVAFLLYVLIRGEFVEGSFKLITKDPIIYFFGLIVMVSLFSLLFNLYKSRYLEFGNVSISFGDRFRVREFRFENIKRMKISLENNDEKNGAFKIVRIKLKNRKRLLVVRPYDYENGEELLKKFQELKLEFEKTDV